MTTAATRIRRVLVVEDDLATAMVHSHILKSVGYAVNIAESGEQALQRVETLKPDVILMDILLPGRNGIEIARELSQRAATARIPVVMITGASSFPVGSGLDGLETVCRYLYKPAHERTLVEGVEEALRWQPQGEA